MSVALDEFLGVNPSRTRVAYRACTAPGSSGAPCFNRDLLLAALHHGGGPRMPSATHNEGIPLDTLRDSLARDVRALLGWG